ncbi:hypothetical protein FHX06_003685 [Rhizobium sp. BK512]|uniref:hypothetical protein n=1 Tax=Rhizobium sp. BK512 TaxID=2587010 RepID=UPI001622BA0F|nr:hypothetical protein [Rhizobium sp. BK512]MBB3562354.1 hypothetical protein [Rhizobium sp. BK512]
MNQPTKPAAGDAPPRPDKTEDENDYFGTADYFSRDRFFTDKQPSNEETSE